jgi:hypothetical protein
VIHGNERAQRWCDIDDEERPVGMLKRLIGAGSAAKIAKPITRQ